MRAAEPIHRLQTRMPPWLAPRQRLPHRRLGKALTAPAATDALSVLERGAARASATLQQAARAAADALHRSPGLRRSAGAGAGLGALRLMRTHPALTAGLALGAVGVAVLIWRRRHARAQAAQPPQPGAEYEPEYL